MIDNDDFFRNEYRILGCHLSRMKLYWLVNWTQLCFYVFIDISHLNYCSTSILAWIPRTDHMNHDIYSLVKHECKLHFLKFNWIWFKSTYFILFYGVFNYHIYIYINNKILRKTLKNICIIFMILCRLSCLSHAFILCKSNELNLGPQYAIKWYLVFLLY